jgi:LPS sulfotransferase NodH
MTDQTFWRRPQNDRLDEFVSRKCASEAAFKVPAMAPGIHYGRQVSKLFATAIERPVARYRNRHDRSVFVCFTNRSGSNFLAESLSQCGVMPRAREYFNLPAIEKFARKAGAASFAEFCHKLITARSVSGMFASKVGLGQIMFLFSEGFLSKVFANPCLIYVKRNDLLEQAISFTIANQTKSWTWDKTPQCEPVYDREEIAKRVALIALSNARFEEFFAVNAIRPYRVVYEDFLEEPQKTIDGIADWLGTKSSRFSSDVIGLRRQSSPRNLEWMMRFLNSNVG